jgi:hypothetical protein
MKGKKTGGRQAGTPNKASAARQAEVAASGVTPLEVMLANMRFHHRQAEELLELLSAAESPEAKIQILGEASRHRQMAQDCAKDAANYVHPKLASIQHGEDPDHPLKSVTDADRLQVMLGVFRENPKLLDQLLKMLNSSKYETHYALSGSGAAWKRDLNIGQTYRWQTNFPVEKSIEQYHREDNERPRGCKIVSLLPD